MIYLIYGVETYKVDVKIKELTKDSSIFYTEQFSKEYIEILYSESFLDKNIVVLSVNDLGGDEQILNFCKKRLVSNDLIIKAKSVNKKTKLYEALKKCATIIECEKLTQDKLENYILAAMKSLKCSITKDALKGFVENSGYYLDDNISLYKINIYLKQLSYFTTSIDIVSVEEVIPKYIDEDTRQLLKYLLLKKDNEMMRLASNLMFKGEPPIKLYGLILRNLRIALKASMFPEKSVKEISEIIGLKSYQMCQVTDMLDISSNKINPMISALQKGTNEIKDGIMPAKLSFIRTIGELICIRDL